MVTYEGWFKFSNLQSEKSVRLNNKIYFLLSSTSDPAELRVGHTHKSSKEVLYLSASFADEQKTCISRKKTYFSLILSVVKEN